MSVEKVREAKEKYTDLLMSKKNVVACGVGYKEVGGKENS